MKLQLTRLHPQVWEFTYKSVPFLVIDHKMENLWLYLCMFDKEDASCIETPETFFNYLDKGNYELIGCESARDLWLLELEDNCLTIDILDINLLKSTLKEVVFSEYICWLNTIKVILNNDKNKCK